jgi:integrase/recombinase XerD
MHKTIRKILLLSDSDVVSVQKTTGNMIGNAELLRSFYLHCRAKGLRAKTIKDYLHRMSYLVNLAGHLDKSIKDVTTDDIREYIIRVLDTVKPITVNDRLKVWRLAYQYWITEAYVEQDPTKPIKKLHEDVIIKPALTVEQLELLLNSFDKKRFTGCRNKMMVLTAVDTCARVGELVSIRLPDLDLNERIITLHHTKGHRDRNVPITPQTAKHLYNYIYRFRRNLPGDRLFCYKDGCPMDVDRLRKILVARSKQLGWPPLGPHCLRRSGAQYLHNAGMSLELLRRLLGHTDIRTTQTYIDSSDMVTLKDAQERLTVLNRIRVA